MSNKVKVDARAAAFIAAWDLAHKADDVIAEGKFACELVSSMLLKMADVYARLATVSEDIGVGAGAALYEREQAKKRAEVEDVMFGDAAEDGGK